jgi:ApaG protein
MKALFPYAETTMGMTVRVSVSFLAEQSDLRQDRWVWAYHIRIENDGAFAAQLMSRRWVITDGRGTKQIVEGEGVVGEQPVITPGTSFDYVSGCPLTTASGSMEGHFEMLCEDGAVFDIAIPKFALIAPVTTRR